MFPISAAVAYTLVSVICVSLLSLLGVGFFLFQEKLIRTSLLFFVSFSTGGLLGDVFIHILPEMSEQKDTFARALLIVLLGILFSFVVEKFIHWRHCHLLPTDHEEAEHHHSVGLMSLMGESMHNFIDGIVIAASFLASIPVGISTALAVAFHEIPHEIGNFAVLLHSGYGKRKALLLNLVSASIAIIGAILVLVSGSMFANTTGLLLPFAAGNLLYIAGSDLIPELHKETGARQGVGQLLCMIVGIVIMYGVKSLE
jgi:zinc and cadmium transporter